jgi:hypothetical protein
MYPGKREAVRGKPGLVGQMHLASELTLSVHTVRVLKAMV